MSGEATEAQEGAELAIEVDINGDIHRLDGPCTITALLDRLGLGGKRVAVAVNRDVVLRSHHAEHRIADGDRIEILEAVGGG